MISRQTYIAGTRFGLGIRADEAESIGRSPGDWIWKQITSPVMSSQAFATLPSSTKNMQYLLEMKQLVSDDKSNKKEIGKEIRQELKDIFRDELRARLQLAITTPNPFYERLVNFWSNHFAVSVKKGKITGLAGAYEREAIRPHITGKFVDMLLAVAHHPAMLMYLDNAQSIGPDSIAGLRRDKGLNENLAREIMELHTLGVDGGYTQKDVTSFANVITGWSIAGKNSDTPGRFEFAARRHEPDNQSVMGKNYADDGEAQGIRVLRDLAHHPATARHICTKLACHFISDNPPEAAINQLATIFLKTGGDLASVYYALIQLPDVWDSGHNPKIKNAYDLVVSAARVTGSSNDNHLDYALAALNFLGGIPFTADSPAGIGDKASDIAGPEAMIRRIEWAQMAANKFSADQKALDLVALTIAPVMSESTAHAIQGAEHEREAVAILFGSPEFQRR